MKKLILISALLLGSNGWADFKPLNEYPIEDIDDDTEMAIQIGTRCIALFKWWGGIKNDPKYKTFEDSALLHSQTESQKYGEMWLQFLFPLLVKDPTQAAAEFQKILSSAGPFVTEYSEVGTENYKKNGDYLEGAITGIDMDICIGLMVDEPIIDDAEYTTEDKAEAIAHFFFFQNKTILDILASQNGRDYHMKLRRVSFDVANRMARSGELSGVYAELEKAMENKLFATNSKYAQILKESILKEFTASEINAMYQDKPKGELRYAQDYVNSDLSFEKYPKLWLLHTATMDPEFSSDEPISLSNRKVPPYSKELANVLVDNKEYFEQVFDQALTEHGYPLEEYIDKEADILGMWVGDYGTHGEETINISKVDNQYIARKITGDVNVPAGEITFQFDTNFNDCKFQIAEIGFKNPDFLGCEVFKLNGSAISLEGEDGSMIHFTRSAPRDGPYEKFYENGQLEERSHYKDGKQESAEERFYDTGELYWKRNFKDGELDGRWESFFIDGKTSALSNWKNGKELSHTKFSYHDNRQLKNKVNFKNGKMEGLGESFNDNGNLLERANYKNGRQEDLREVFYDNGNLQQRGNYKNGKREGTWETFFENGQLERRANYKNGKQDDLREVFYDNGNLQQRGNYKNGRQDGLWEEFDVDGNLTYTQQYKDGVLQE